MPYEYYQSIQMLNKCSFIPGSWDKRFVRSLAKQPDTYELTETQIKWLKILLYKYRRQLGITNMPEPADYPRDIRAMNKKDDDIAKLERWKRNVE